MPGCPTAPDGRYGRLQWKISNNCAQRVVLVLVRAVRAAAARDACGRVVLPNNVWLCFRHRVTKNLERQEMK